MLREADSLASRNTAGLMRISFGLRSESSSVDLRGALRPQGAPTKEAGSSAWPLNASDEDAGSAVPRTLRAWRLPPDFPATPPHELPPADEPCRPPHPPPPSRRHELPRPCQAARRY